MSNAKHTPGPWNLAGKTTISNRDQSFCLANVGTYSISDEEAEANARLIAAAPELLVIAQRLVEEGLSTGLVSEARAAIAKATGETK